MALDARRRQKKAEKRKAKEKTKRKELARQKSEGDGARLARVAGAPFLHCVTLQCLWDQGMAEVLVSRDLASGQVAFAIFLVDRYCLGVKDAFCGFLARREYFDKVYAKVTAAGDVIVLKPAAARKLVEEAVEYARKLGFSPQGNYYDAKQIFGSVDPAESDREFEFGSDGKPLFISGPHDSPWRCASIVGILNQNCGAGGYDYLVHVPAGALDATGVLDLAGAFDEHEDAEDKDAEDEDDNFEYEDEDNTIEGFVHIKRASDSDR